MPARPAPALGLRDGDRERLAGWVRFVIDSLGSGAAGADRAAGS